MHVTSTARMSQGGTPWLILLLLCVLVLAPTACLLWFMTRAVGNERLAVRQKLRDAYQQQLGESAGALQQHWNAMTATQAESIVLFDAGGRPVAPVWQGTPAPTAGMATGLWQRADQLEFADRQPAAAAGVYRQILLSAPGSERSAYALRGLVRNYLKAGQWEDAYNALRELEGDAYRNQVDSQGWRLVPAVQLLALQSRPTEPQHGMILSNLLARLAEQGSTALPLPQRNFIRRQLLQLEPSLPFPGLAGDEVAELYLQRHPALPPEAQLVVTGGLWCWRASNAYTVAVFSAPHLSTLLRVWVAPQPALPGIQTVAALITEPAPREPFLRHALRGAMPGWELRLFVEDETPFTRAAHRQTLLYAWIACLVIALVVLVALAAGRHLLRQMRLTQMKNDFVANVSHELKTPLASMRLLVDTLIEGRIKDQQQAMEYLQLIARENERLSRLIENFLGFSRMERNKQAFEFEACAPALLAERAVAAVQERFKTGGFELRRVGEEQLPMIMADADALVTALVNLLDNAFKYSGPARLVELRVAREAAWVVFAVRDHGIGMSKKEVRHAFDRFYQADNSLTRTTGGCGLGLSIVKFIVDAHQGDIQVSSQPGAGSEFKIRIPAAGDMNQENT